MSTFDVYRTVCENFDDHYANILQKHSMIPSDDSDSNNPELQVNLDHLDKATKQLFLNMKKKYKDLYSTHKYHVVLLQ